MGCPRLREPILVAALIAACGEAPADHLEISTSSTTEVEEVVATALPSETSVAGVAPPPVAQARPLPPPWCGRVTVPMLSKAEEQRLVDEFRRRNPSRNTVRAHASSSSHYLGGGLVQPEGDPRVTDEASAIAAARKLAEKNADLLGFTAAEVRGAEATTRRMMGDRWVDLRRDIPRRGYERFPSFARNVRIRVNFHGGLLFSSEAPLPDFKLCLNAPLPATSEQVTRGAIRQWEPGRGSSWRPTASDITSVEPTIYVERDPQARTVTLTLAYEVKIGETLSAFVDASSGVRLGARSHVNVAKADQD